MIGRKKFSVIRKHQIFFRQWKAIKYFTINRRMHMTDFHWYSLWGEGVGITLANLFSLIVGMICTQTYIQAIFSAQDPQTASIGALVAALIVIPVGLPCVTIGMYMHAAHPEVSPLLALPVFLLKYQPLIVGSVAMGGILLSLISSIAGLSLGIGTMISRDILPHAKESGTLLRTRRSSDSCYR